MVFIVQAGGGEAAVETDIEHINEHINWHLARRSQSQWFGNFE